MKKGTQQIPKHKPNTRHTLNEVLHSLQDMMNNELAGIELSPQEIAGGKSRKNKKKNKETVLRNLKALIGSAVPSFGTPAAETDTATDDGDDGGKPTARTGRDDAFPDTGPTRDADPPQPGEAGSPAVDDFALEMEDADQPTPFSARRNRDEGKKARKPPASASQSPADARTEQVEINWDDIPVLNEVVAPPPMPDGTTSQQAREIAIKVAAALNVELRKEGTDTMDVKTIMRLQSLLGRELTEHGGGVSPDTGETKSANKASAADSDGDDGLKADNASGDDT